jgi:hypothetical protein
LSAYSSWTPIGDSTYRFIGTFNGNGHTISNLTIDDSGSNYQGLFGHSEGSQIYELDLLDVNITGNNYVGGLVGYNDSSTVVNCSATGKVNGTNYVGGLVGYNYNSSTISNGFATGEVTGETHVGGLVGQNDSSTVSNSYATSTALMQTESTFTAAGWDFADETVNGSDDFWDLDATVNGGYPWLKKLADSY